MICRSWANTEIFDIVRGKGKQEKLLPTKGKLNAETMDRKSCCPQTHNTETHVQEKLPAAEQTTQKPWTRKAATHKRQNTETMDKKKLLPTTHNTETMDEKSCYPQTHNTETTGKTNCYPQRTKHIMLIGPASPIGTVGCTAFVLSHRDQDGPQMAQTAKNDPQVAQERPQMAQLRWPKTAPRWPEIAHVRCAPCTHLGAPPYGAH